MKVTLNKIYWVLREQVGIDPLKFLRFLFRIFPFIILYYKYKKASNENVVFFPCLHDFYANCGESSSEYFWQDLLVARLIYKFNPINHLDIGSRLDGFIAHVASFRKIEVADIRPLNNSIPNVSFYELDIMKNLSEDMLETYESISCLHAIEHFGLGRYGDPITNNGYEIAIQNISKMIKKNGKLFLSTPSGKKRVEFNSNRVFDPIELLNICKSNGLELCNFYSMDNDYNCHSDEDLVGQLSKYQEKDYSLIVYEFRKK